MSGPIESVQLVGLRELADYTDKARTTVKAWCDRSTNPLPHTKNSKGHYVVDSASVDDWLEFREETPEEEKAEAKAVQIATAAEKLRGMELDNDEREFKKNQREGEWAHREEYRQAYRERLLKIREWNRKFIAETKKKMPNAQPSEIEELDRDLVKFFNEVAIIR